ncbi:MAG: sulfatase-like hydrolase/transferase [Pirellulaceae bacterium]
MTMSDERRENVLVVFCDQLRTDLLGCYGSKLVRTPNIDALAADSLVFENAYTPTAICSPARASLMTGLYAHGHHMFNNSTPRYSYCHHLPPNVTMIQDWADEATDYQTGYFGKWHIGPTADLFNSNFHKTHPRETVENGGPLFAAGLGHPNLKLGELVEAKGDRNIPPGEVTGTVDVPVDDFPDMQAARYTNEFIEESDPERPFLAFCSFPGPHSPWLVPEEFGIRYDPDDIPLWANRNDPLEGKPLNQHKLQLLTTKRQDNISTEERDDNLRQKLSVCFSYIELIDQCLGEIIDYLKKNGLYDKTAIFFTADHGDMAGSHGFHSKGSYMYDEIYRIPMLYKPTGSNAHRRFDEPVHLMDVTATCVDIMGGGARNDICGQAMHGKSLRTFESETPEWPRNVHYAQYHGDWYGHYSARMVTDGRWKLVWNFSDLCELYDLESDPDEMRNRFYDPDCREVRTTYFAHLAEEARKVNDGQALKFIEEYPDTGGHEDEAIASFMKQR